MQPLKCDSRRTMVPHEPDGSACASDNDEEDAESLDDRKDSQKEHMVLHYYIINYQLTLL